MKDFNVGDRVITTSPIDYRGTRIEPGEEGTLTHVNAYALMVDFDRLPAPYMGADGWVVYHHEIRHSEGAAT